MNNGIEKAFASFLANDKDLEAAIVSATKASWGGSGYSVELFPDGTYRVLWDNDIGNLHHSSGIILSIPTLTEDEYSPEDGLIPFFENAIEELREGFAHLEDS